MKIKVYQLDKKKDERNLLYLNYHFTEKRGGVKPDEYKCVFDGEISAQTLEDVFMILNGRNYPAGFRGRKLSVSDVVEVLDWDDRRRGAYFCDAVGFKKIEFAGEQAEKYPKY